MTPPCHGDILYIPNLMEWNQKAKLKKRPEVGHFWCDKSILHDDSRQKIT